MRLPAVQLEYDVEFCSSAQHFPLYVRLRTLYSRFAWDYVQARLAKPAEADLGRDALPPLVSVRRSDDQTAPQSRGKPRSPLLTAASQD